jgi:Rrf2 family protein
MITRETDYAIRVLLFLSKNNSGELASTTEIAEKMQMPYRFLRKIVHNLTNCGLITAVRGKYGGIKLAKDPASISLYKVIQMLDHRSVLLNSCCDHSCENEPCARTKVCTVHDRLEELQKYLSKELKKINFAELTR